MMKNIYTFKVSVFIKTRIFFTVKSAQLYVYLRFEKRAVWERENNKMRRMTDRDLASKGTSAKVNALLWRLCVFFSKLNCCGVVKSAGIML